jgi:S-layer protein
MTSLTIKDFDTAMNLGATNKGAVSKMVKAWEAKNDQRVKRAAGLGLMAVSLAACNADVEITDDDLDGDGFANIVDAFPNDATEWQDTDSDGFGDNADQHPTVANLADGSIALTVGVDTISVAAGNASTGNDVFTAVDASSANGALTFNNPTLTALDSIDGGAGNDTLNITTIAAFAVPAGVTVVNVETANITSTLAVTADTSAWTGLTALNSTAVGDADLTAAATTNVVSTVSAVAAGTLTVLGGNNVTVNATGVVAGTTTVGALAAGVGVGAAGNVVVNASGTAAGTAIGLVTVHGGDTITVNQTAANAVNTTTTLGGVTVTGDAGTTAVTVNNAAAAIPAAAVVGVTIGGVVTITDAADATALLADSIRTVTLSNFGATNIDSSALTTLNVTGGAVVGVASSTIDLDSQSAITPATALTINSAGGFMGAIDTVGNANYTTINVNSSAATTIADLTTATTITTTLNFTGAGATTLTANTLHATLVDINVTGTGGVTLGTALAAGTDFDGSDGADSITITGATTQSITMGGGNDTVTITGATVAGTGLGVAGTLAGGEGTDTLVMAKADAISASANAAFNTDVSGFETLRISDALAAADNIDVDGLNDVTRVEITTAAAVAATISNLNSGGTVELEAGMTTLTVEVQSALVSAADTLNLELNNATLTAFGTIVAANVETINISAADATAAGGNAVIHTATLQATGATSISVSGNNGLNLTNTGNVAVTNFDASGVVANGTAVADTPANLAVTFASENVTVGAVVTITGGAGNDALTGGAGALDTIRGGAGNDAINGGTGVDTLVFESTFLLNGTDTVTGFVAGVGGDIIDISITLADLRGTGAVAEDLGVGATLGANTGLVISTGDLANAAAVELYAEGLVGEAAGDAIFVLGSTDYDAAGGVTSLYRVDYTGAGDATVTTLATFNAFALNTLTADNLADYTTIA